MNDVVIETLNEAVDLVGNEETSNPVNADERAKAIQALTDELPAEKFIQPEEVVS